MTMTSLQPNLKKGQWQDITPNKIPIKVSYSVDEKKRRSRALRIGDKKTTKLQSERSYNVTRVAWVLPQNALSGDYEIDFARIDENKIKFPTPDDTSRMHLHEGINNKRESLEEHLVSELHSDFNTREDHKDERILYERNYYKLQQKQDEAEVKTERESRKLERERNQLLKKKNVISRTQNKLEKIEEQLKKLEKKKTPKNKIKRKELKEESSQLQKKVKKVPVVVQARLDELEEELSGIKQEKTQKKETESRHWLDKYRVKRGSNENITVNGKPNKAETYSLGNADFKIFLFQLRDSFYISSKKLKSEKFASEQLALKRIEEIFETKRLRENILFKSLELQKSDIFNQINEILTKKLSPTDIEDSPDSFRVFSEYQAGDNKVVLEGNENGKYLVKWEINEKI